MPRQWKPDRDLSNISVADLAYTAGIIDGEGCIHIARQKDKESTGGIAYVLAVRVGTTDGVIPYHLQSLFGGCVVNAAPRRAREISQDIWQAVGAHAEAVLRLVQPFLVLKGDQAKLALEFRAGFGRPGSGALNDETRRTRQAFYEKMRALKTRAKRLALVRP